MSELWMKLVFLCPMLILAGIIDGISGGGGLIALPSYLLAGLPISTAYGCNKMQSCLGTSTSLFKYAKSGYVDVRMAFPSALAAILGSFCATQIMLRLSDSVKNVIITGSMIFVIILTLLTRRRPITGSDHLRVALSFRSLLKCMLLGILLGLFDGFFGPGGGTVAVLLFSLVFHYDLRVGCGNGKLIIVLSNLTALITYIINGDVLYAIAIPCSLSNMLGSYIGASVATSKGGQLIRKISLVVVIALGFYTIYTLVAPLLF